MSADTLIAILGVLALLAIGAWSALKRRFTTRKVRERWPSRPLPDATQRDLDRIVRRDFPVEQFSEIMAALGELDNRLGFEYGLRHLSWQMGAWKH